MRQNTLPFSRWHVALLAVLLAIPLLVTFAACTPTAQSPGTEPSSSANEDVSHDDAAASRNHSDSASATPTPEETESETEIASPTPAFDPFEITVVAGGDVLLHPTVWEAARQANGSLDFSRQFAGITPFVSGADLALCGFESQVVPAGNKPSGYPRFGAPPEIVPALKAAGFDGCSIANNHSLDYGVASIQASADAFSAAGMGFSGAGPTPELAREIPFYTVRKGDHEVKIAHISATTITNGLRAPADKAWALNAFDPWGPITVDAVIADAKRARELGADIVIVSMHWGIEYISAPNEEQREVAAALADSGEVDIIFGSHSHTPQPIEKLPGGPHGRGTWVTWSMGNMISGQTVANHGYRVTTGYLATATISISPDDGAQVQRIDWTAVTVDEPAGRSAYLLHDLVANNTSPLSTFEVSERQRVTAEVMNVSSPERTELPVAGGDETTMERISLGD